MIPGILDERRAEVSAYGIVFRLTVLVVSEHEIDVVGCTVVVFDDGVDDVGRAWPVVHAAWDHLWGMGTFAMPHSDGEWRV